MTGPTALQTRKWLVLASMCLGLAMLMIDTFIVNVALPAIGADLSAGLGRVEWTVTGYVLVVGVMPVAMGRLGDILGRRRIYLSGLAVFVTASLACGLAPTIEALIAFRVLQGIAAATIMPGTLSILTNVFPAHQRGLAIGIWGGVSGLGLIAGPVLGGLLVSSGEWRWIFLVNLPVGLLAALMARAFVPETRDETASRRIDWAGLVTLSGGLFLALLGVTQGGPLGWTSPATLGLFASGAALLVLFVAIERRVRAPLVDLSLFRNGTFVAACLAAFLFSATVFGGQPYMSLFMQNYWGFTPLQGGLAFLPATVLVAMLMPVSGIVGQRLGSRLRLLLVFASLCVLGSALYLLTLTTSSGYLDGLLPPFIARGLGIGLFMSASSYAVVASVPLGKSGLASGTLTMARQVGTAVGVTVLGAVYLRHLDANVAPQLAGFSEAEAAAAMAGAAHFVNVAQGAAAEVVRQGILDAFLATVVATSVMSAVAAAAAWLIRLRPAATPATPAAAPASAPQPARASVAVAPTPATATEVSPGGEGGA
jgi:DHA2 family methylenomycin A resistance protein-like MFS transporter